MMLFLCAFNCFFVLFLLIFSSGTALGWSTECWDPSNYDFEAPRVLLYSTLGTYSATYFEMLQVMIRTASFHLGPNVDIVIFAHHSWSTYLNGSNASQIILLDEAAFFDMKYAQAGAERPSVPSQASANKLRIFQLVPSAQQYDVIVMLDADIMVLANFLWLIGHICNDTLYTVSHRFFPVSRRSVVYFQSRGFTAAEMSYVKKKDLVLFNAGQFVFRPSAFMEKLFWKAYQSYKQNPLATLYEQGHMNTVFLLESKVKFTLTHLTLLGSVPAVSARVPGEYALVHVCDFETTAAQKLAIMRRFLGAAFQPLAVVQPNILSRLWRCVDTSQECGFFARVHRHSRGRGKRGSNASETCVMETSPELRAAYTQFVSQPDVTHMCEVGSRQDRGRTAAMALFANPSAGLTLFSNVSINAMRNLRAVFPSRIVHLPGPLEVSLSAYAAMVAAGRHPPCSSVLLPESWAAWAVSPALQRILAPSGRLFVAGGTRPPAWLAATPDAARTATLPDPIQEVTCQNATAQGRQGWWCTGRLLPSPSHSA